MAVYKYVAKDMQAKKFKGQLEASDRNELVSLLRSKNLFLVEFNEVNENKVNTYKLKLNELSDYSREIATMVGSGLTLIRTFTIMIQRAEKEQIKEIYKDIYLKLQQGFSLSNAMEAQGKAFPELMIQMYRSGETSGQLEKTARIMANQYAKDHKLRGKVKSAMIYPIILVVVTILVVMIIFTFVLPTFFETFEGQDLPIITQIVMGIAKGFQNNLLYIIIAILIIIVGLKFLFTLEKPRIWLDKKKITFPKMGKLMRIIYTARFARTLSSLYSSGISLVNGLSIAQRTIGNKYIEKQFDQAIYDLRNGSSLSSAIEKIDGFDVKLTSSIFVGEESGQLDSMLVNLANDFDEQAEQATGRLVAMLEPIMIIILAVFICIIVISVLLPIYAMYNNVSQM